MVSNNKRQDLRIEKEAKALKRNLDKRKKQAAELQKLKNQKTTDTVKGA